jgi:hypothetical protein
MADTLNQTQLAQIVSAVISALQVQGAAPKGAAPQPKNSFGKFDPIAKDRQLLAAFHRRGFKDVQLLDRNDPTKPYNVRPFGSAENKTGWLGQGRIVRRGERGVRGLFHIDQTDPVQPMTPERKGMFRKAAKKAKLTPVS